MITVRKSAERGHANHGWLDSYHTFSFADYYDPAFMGFRSLRVINEDRVDPSRGFGMHPHKNMEIITYVVSGAIEHQDSFGGHAILKPGEIQHMTAGKGIFHSEMNPSADEAVHLLQIWIEPDTMGLAPGYEQKTLPAELEQGSLTLIAGKNAADGAVQIHQDVRLYAGKPKAGAIMQHSFAEGRAGWLQLISGEIELGGKTLGAGDGAAIEAESAIQITARKNAEFLLFDLA